VRLSAYELVEEKEVLAWKLTTRKKGCCSGDHCVTHQGLGGYKCVACSSFADCPELHKSVLRHRVLDLGFNTECKILVSNQSAMPGSRHSTKCAG
jgi:hypothetical protein